MASLKTKTAPGIVPHAMPPVEFHMANQPAFDRSDLSRHARLATGISRAARDSSWPLRLSDIGALRLPFDGRPDSALS